MERKAQNNIVDFFQCFARFCEESKSILKSCQQIFSTLVEQSKDFCAVDEADIEQTPLSNFPQIKEILMSKIIDEINITSSKLDNYGCKLEHWHKKLANKLSTVEANVKDIDFFGETLLAKGSALQPKLGLIMEFASDACNYALYVSSKVGMITSTLHLDFSNWEALADNNLKIDKHWKERIDTILLLMQYCSQNEMISSTS